MTRSYVQSHLCESQSTHSAKEFINREALVFIRETARNYQHSCARVTVWQRKA